MNHGKNLDQQLQLLREAVSPQPSFVDAVMSRVLQTRVAPSRSAVFRRSMVAFLQPRRLAVAACVIGIAVYATLPFGGKSNSSTGGWWLAPAYGQQLVAIFDTARAGGITAREQVDFILSDGARHRSSTVDTFFLSQDRYRRDIYDNKQLRESQWYVPDAHGMVQTSVRFDSKTYVVDIHPDASLEVDRVAQLRAIVKFVDRADRRLEPEKIEGRECIGFEILGAKLDGLESGAIYHIWFDAETKLPARIEIDLSKSEKPAAPEPVRGIILTLDHFDWNPRLPGNTFTPYIPENFRKATPQ